MTVYTTLYCGLIIADFKEATKFRTVSAGWCWLVDFGVN